MHKGRLVEKGDHASLIKLKVAIQLFIVNKKPQANFNLTFNQSKPFPIDKLPLNSELIFVFTNPSILTEYQSKTCVRLLCTLNFVKNIHNNSGLNKYHEKMHNTASGKINIF